MAPAQLDELQGLGLQSWGLPDQLEWAGQDQMGDLGDLRAALAFRSH